MAQKPSGGKMEPNKTVLIGGLACIFLGIAWFAWEELRPPTEKEIQEEKDRQKMEAEKNRLNRPKPAPAPEPAAPAPAAPK